MYCINADRSELSGGIATLADADGDAIQMSFRAKLLTGFAYRSPPNAPMIGFAHFTGGTVKWAGSTGDAILSGQQNGDGTASLVYHDTIYVPK